MVPLCSPAPAHGAETLLLAFVSQSGCEHALSRGPGGRSHSPQPDFTLSGEPGSQVTLKEQ